MCSYYYDRDILGYPGILGSSYNVVTLPGYLIYIAICILGYPANPGIYSGIHVHMVGDTLTYIVIVAT